VVVDVAEDVPPPDVEAEQEHRQDGRDPRRVHPDRVHVRHDPGHDLRTVARGLPDAGLGSARDDRLVRGRDALGRRVQVPGDDAGAEQQRHHHHDGGQQAHDPAQQRRRGRVAERQQQHADAGVQQQDVALPQQHHVGDAEHRQHGQPAQEQAGERRAALLCAHHLHREAEPEQEREQREELRVDQQQEQRVDHAVDGRQVRADAPQLTGRGERRDVDEQDATQCEAA
jgi:hypothetical protein